MKNTRPVATGLHHRSKELAKVDRFALSRTDCVAVDKIIPNACAVIRITRQASGSAANPSRRVTRVDLSVNNACRCKSVCIVNKSLHRTLEKKKVAHFGSRRLASRFLGRYCPGKHHVLAQHIHVTPINSGLNMIEFGNEAMFHPIHNHFGKYDREHWLDISAETRKLVVS
jgi:hypothetical protein